MDYDAVKINSKVRMNGAFLKEGEQVGIVDTDTGREVFDQLEDEREFSSVRIEKDITAPDSNRKIIREIARYAGEHEKETGRFPKTLIFAVNDLPHTSHAGQVVRICREVFGRGDDFVPDQARPFWWGAIPTIKAGAMCQDLPKYTPK